MRVHHPWILGKCGALWGKCERVVSRVFVLHRQLNILSKSFLPKCSFFTQVMKLLSRSWTVYTRHKICKNGSILSDTSKLWSQGDPRGRCTHSPHSPCLNGCMHGWGLGLCMPYTQCKDETKGWEVKWHNLLLHIKICRRVNASSLHLTTGTGSLQSCSPLIIPFLCYSLWGHKEESG